MSWADFRGKLLGPTDPAAAPAGSLREQIYSKWEDLGRLAWRISRHGLGLSQSWTVVGHGRAW